MQMILVQQRIYFFQQHEHCLLVQEEHMFLSRRDRISWHRRNTLSLHNKQLPHCAGTTFSPCTRHTYFLTQEDDPILVQGAYPVCVYSRNIFMLFPFIAIRPHLHFHMCRHLLLLEAICIYFWLFVSICVYLTLCCCYFSFYC